MTLVYLLPNSVGYTCIRQNITKLCQKYYQFGNNNTVTVINITKLGHDHQIRFLDVIEGARESMKREVHGEFVRMKGVAI